MSRPLRLAALALLLITACGACSKEKIVRANRLAVVGVGRAASEVDRIIKEMHLADMTAAAQVAKDKAIAAGVDWASLPDDQKDSITLPAIMEVEARFNATGTKEALAAFINLTHAYARAVQAADGDPSWATIRPILRDLMSAYANLRTALGKRGDRLPDLPSILIAITE